MEYSVYRFIRQDLNMSPNEFVKLVGMPQSSLSNHKQRNRTVGDLPILLLIYLADTSELSYEEVVNKLSLYEAEYELERIRKKETTFMENPNTDFKKTFDSFVSEGTKFGHALNKNKKLSKINFENLWRQVPQPHSDNPDWNKFINKYLQLCLEHEIPAFQEISMLPKLDDALALAQVFMVAANQVVFAPSQ